MNKHQKNLADVIEKQMDIICTLVRLKQFSDDCRKSNSVALPIAESMSAQIEYLIKSQRVMIQKNIELVVHV